MTTPRPSERRLVHVLFVDLVGFTSLVEQLDAEDVAVLQEHYFSQVAGLVAAGGGQVEKYIGDAVLATFGLPVLGPDDGVGAVRAGLAVIESMTRVEAELGLPAGTLRVRVGVHTGEVVVTWAPDGSWRLSGDVVNTAARLQSVAAPGTVAVGPDTALAVGEAFVVEPLGEVALKGRAERVAAYRVVPRPAGAGGRVARFRDAAADLALLAEAHRGARGAERLTVLAPPGVGRTRLVEEFRARTAAPVWLARVRRDEPGYAPVAALLTEAGVTPATVVDRLTRHGVVGPRAEVSARHTAALLTGDRLDGTPEELWTSWTAVLDAQGGPTPVWVLDDVHLAGADLHAFLAHATAAPHRTARLVVLTARPGEHSPTGAVHVLDPLTDDDVAAVVADRAELAPDVVARIQRAAGGNPLYVVELLRSWELANPGTAGVPSTVRAIYLGQLDALPAPSRALLGQGSVAGRTLPASALPELGVPEPERPLAELTGAGLLTGPHPGVDDPASYTYRHAVLRDTAYATLPRARRAALHLRFATWLSDRGGRVELVARHLTSALDEAPAFGGPIDGRVPRDELARRAAAALTRAGEAVIGSEPQRAAELFARAHDVGVTADPAPSGLRAYRRLRHAEALRRAGRLVDAMPAFTAVAEAAEPGTHAARAGAALGYEDALFDSRLPRAEWGARSLELLGDALALTPRDDAGLRSRLLAALARAHGYGGDAATAHALGEEAIALARGADDPGALAYALLARRPMLAAPASIRARLADDAELVATARAAGDREREFEALRVHMVDRLEVGSTDEAVALAAEAGRLAERPLHLWYPAMWRAMMQLHHGRPDEAAEAVEHFRREGERWHYGDAGQVHGVQLLTLHTLLGTPGLALPMLRRTAAEVGGRTWMHVAVGHARAGQLDEAARLLTWCAADGFAMLGHDGARAFLLAEAAEIADAVGDAVLGAVLHDLLAPWDGLAVVVGSGALCLGAAEHFRGLAARAAGRDAAHHLHRALEFNEATGAVHAAARSRAALRPEGTARC
ncbi:adenylate/guanylate cyclase domain-containing protein [Actinomycetospora atypica]|uniref:Adenylate/guanylate cyclase domain-containing protein n=1 Tax=Actinomycetospora atypica TaxID=1290095 RepID=A0ABV9YP58_9PSEU